ncbi:hypothetical protein [Roseococcus sp. YIM B11640]|uniref:hypothetical protein n=1 Tax=Roseococcus sp. YIM B11640 TaxID=3133973 RepID=UPI003C7B00ED
MANAVPNLWAQSLLGRPAEEAEQPDNLLPDIELPHEYPAATPAGAAHPTCRPGAAAARRSQGRGAAARRLRA